MTQEGRIFNLSGQIWNHTFYWHSMSPQGGGEPHGPIAEAIVDSFGNFQTFKDRFSTSAGGHFGSGWAWLVFNPQGGKLEILDTHDAFCPLRLGLVPILTCDVWEHAYYIDYKNLRVEYVKAWWNLVNWEFANENLTKVKN